MKIVKKSILWKLTFPFAHKNYTIIGDTIYSPTGTASASVMAHEKIHLEQRKKVGSLKFYFLYLFAFPLFKNKYRANWEIEAYIHGSKYTLKQAKQMVYGTTTYGWLKE
jgi:hypothetical protein